MRRLPLRRSLAEVLLLVAFFLSGCSVDSTTARVDSDSGAARYYYDDNDRRDGAQCFAATIVIGVGTAMTVDDYGKLADAIVNELNHDASALLVIFDPVPHSPIKLYPKPFARALNRLVAQLQETSSEDSIHCLQKNATIVVGGHSASGAGAFYGTKYFDFPVSGFLGLDPFPIQQTQQLFIPALYWGFARTTCGVSVSHAALAAYNQSLSGYRVMYQLQNDNHHQKLPPPNVTRCNYAHCAFTDTGCMVVCPLKCSMDAANDLRRDVAISVRLFLRAISTSKDHGSFSHRTFAYDGFHLNPKENFQLIMDEEVVKQGEYDNNFDILDRSLLPR